MTDYPVLTVGICTYKRPWYAVHCLLGFINRMGYAGKIKFHIADGGSSAEDLKYYRQLLNGIPASLEITDNLADMCNSCSRNGGDLWITCMDDYVLRRPINVTPDVDLLLSDPEIGVVRMSRLAYWGANNGDPGTYAKLVAMDGLHWLKIDKERTTDPYLSSIGVHLYHRRFWDAYGDIPMCPPNVPGQAELNGMNRFNGHPGPTVAVPLRFGEDSFEGLEPFWHIGMWHTDEYAQAVGTRL